MTSTLRIVLFIATFIYLILIIKKIKKRELQVSFAMFWIFSALILFIFLIFPQLLGILSDNLGFKTPSNMIFVVTIFIAYYLIYNLTSKLSQENKKNTILIQEVSMLKKRVENLENTNTNTNKNKKMEK